MVAKCNSKTHFYKKKKIFCFFTAVSSAFSLHSKFAKSANMINKKIFYQKCNMGIKNAELDADFESVEKVAENIKRKSYQ